MTTTMTEAKTIDVLDKGYVRLVDHIGGDHTVVSAARVSYDRRSELNQDGSLTERDERLLRFLIREGHWSPFRQCAVTFEVYAPLMVARQWVKHAVASSHIEDQFSHNESSRRYVTEEPTFYIPMEDQWRGAPENSKQGSGDPLPTGVGSNFTKFLMETCENGEKLYNRAMEAGICAEQARLFLPAYGMYVRWRWFTSLQAIVNFLNLRIPHDAQQEIQDYAKAVRDLTEPLFPATFKFTNEAWSNESD